VNPLDIKKFRSQAHALKPVILIGQSGLTDAVLNEIQLALDTHELIKIKIRSTDRQSRKEISANICSTTEAELIQSIGQIIVLYREKPKND
jgi:RNA-binding protein